LEERGLKLLYEASAMISSCDSAIRAGTEKLRVEEVTFARLDLYVDTFMSCWEMPSEMKDEFRTGVAAGLKDPQMRFRCYIGFLDERPVATGGLLNITSGAYLASGTVHPNYRGRGLYKALLSHRAKVAKSLGHKNLLIHAKTHTAAPICTKLGFETVYTHQVYSRESL
jgi:GNAT superfamily N-acetyltransferase